MSTTIPASTTPVAAAALAAENTNIEPNATFASWAVLELLGHRQLAGWVTEQQIAGVGFLRIDIPKKPSPSLDNSEQAGNDQAEKEKEVLSTQFYAPAAVYGLTPVTEEMARNIAYRSQLQPVVALGLPPAQVASNAISARFNPEIDDYEDEDDSE